MLDKKQLSYNIQPFGHCIATSYAMSRSLVKQTEKGTSWAGLDSDLIVE